jgi:hypothetical protein
VDFTSRYDALGIPDPDPATMCTGDCEGTGWVPVKADDENVLYRDLWNIAEATSKTDDGWHFVSCPACGGTGLRLGVK